MFLNNTSAQHHYVHQWRSSPKDGENGTHIHRVPKMGQKWGHIKRNQCNTLEQGCKDESSSWAWLIKNGQVMSPEFRQLFNEKKTKECKVTFRCLKAALSWLDCHLHRWHHTLWRKLMGSSITGVIHMNSSPCSPCTLTTMTSSIWSVKTCSVHVHQRLRW